MLTATGAIVPASVTHVTLVTLVTLVTPVTPVTPVTGALIPSSVTLDLAGCVACLSLANSNAHVFFSDLHLVGLAHLDAAGAAQHDANNTGLISGASLALPLWALKFGRLDTLVHLHNVTLTLPQEEFALVLGLASAGRTVTSVLAAGAAAGSGQQVVEAVGLAAFLELQVQAELQAQTVLSRL